MTDGLMRQQVRILDQQCAPIVVGRAKEMDALPASDLPGSHVGRKHLGHEIRQVERWADMQDAGMHTLKKAAERNQQRTGPCNANDHSGRTAREGRNEPVRRSRRVAAYRVVTGKVAIHHIAIYMGDRTRR